MNRPRCGTCERLEMVNDALRDRCGTLELINEGLNERAVAQLNCDYNVDLNGRVAVLQLDRAVRRIAQLEATVRELESRLAPPVACPQCGSCRISVVSVPLSKDPDTGYVDGGEIYRCGRCESTGPVGEVKRAA